VAATPGYLAATIIHADRFTWHYPPTWLWALVYAGVPLDVPFDVAGQERTLPRADLLQLTHDVGSPRLGTSSRAATTRLRSVGRPGDLGVRT
jgi:hypothetical protein